MINSVGAYVATKETKETLTSQPRHAVIVGGYMIRKTALLSGKHAITVVDLIVSQPYVAVESVGSSRDSERQGC